MRKAKGYPSLSRYVIDVNAFKMAVPIGRRKVVFELAGISADCYGQYMAGLGMRDPNRRELLAKESGVPVSVLWREIKDGYRSINSKHK